MSLRRPTYRELVKRYPQLKYQVGRACAVAGYTDLFRGLNLVPEVHLAEEARDNSSSQIFEDIMTHRDKFSIMNDYNLSVSDETCSHPLQCLNGDTAVRSSLDIKRKFSREKHGFWLKSEDIYFNITEDLCLDTVDYTPASITAAKKTATEYLYTALPRDLPALDKDVLIVVAASNGDVDRYTRLHRPGWYLSAEHGCIIRGIYHNTFFAKWWSTHGQKSESPVGIGIERPLTARAIMNNDLSRIDATTIMPYCIWYPKVPSQSTLELLMARRPDMAHEVAGACVVGNYVNMYDELDPLPHPGLRAEARASANSHYLQHLERKLRDGGDELAKRVNGQRSRQGWKLYTKDNAFDAAFASLAQDVCAQDASSGFGWIYDDLCARISPIELHVSATNGFEEGTGTMMTAFDDEINTELAEKGWVDLEYEYGEEAKRLNGSGTREA